MKPQDLMKGGCGLMVIGLLGPPLLLLALAIIVALVTWVCGG